MAAQARCDGAGIDSSTSAVRLAEAKARERGTRVRFEVGDARRLESPDEQFARGDAPGNHRRNSWSFLRTPVEPTTEELTMAGLAIITEACIDVEDRWRPG